MLAQKTGGSIVTITAALARNPIRGVTAAVPMITKGGLETITQHLAMEYAKDGIRVNAVAPGVVDTPLHRETPRDVMQSLSPMGRVSTVKDISYAVFCLKKKKQNQATDLKTQLAQARATEQTKRAARKSK